MKEALEYTTPPEDRVPLTRKVFYSLGQAAEPMFGGTIGNYLVFFYNSVLGLNAATIGLLLFIPRMWDAVTDPVMGQISDRTRSRWGRRRPYILLGGILCAITYTLHWIPPSFLQGATALLVYVVIINCLYYTAHTILIIPYNALGIELSPDYKERTSIMAIRKVLHSFGDISFGIFPLAAAWLAILFNQEGNDKLGYGLIGTVIGVITLVLLILTFLGTRERPLPEKERGKIEVFAMFKSLGNPLFLHFIAATLIFVLSIFSLASYHVYLFVYYLDNRGLLAIYQVVNCSLQIPMAFFWWWLANHIGKARTIFWSMFTICIGCLSTFFVFNRDMPYLVFIYAVLFGSGYCGFLVMSPSILADIVDMDELRVGRRREGLLSGMYNFCMKLGFAGAGAVLGFGVQWAGFVPDLGVNQSEQTFFRLRLLTALLSGGFAALSALVYWFFPLTPERALEARRTLEARRGKTEAVH